MKVFRAPFQFEWDAGNRGKNFAKHAVTDAECEEAFFDHKKKVLADVLHSGKEERYLVLGQTKHGRLLFVVCAIREERIRIISARDLNRREYHLYEKETHRS